MISNEIWTIAEVKSGSLSRTTLQILGKARELADKQGLKSAAVLLGGTQALATELAGFADSVLWAGQPKLDVYEAGSRLAALSKLSQSRGMPRAILAPASSNGLEFMPRLAARLRSGYLSSCVDLWWNDGNLAARRPIYGGKVYENTAFVATPAVATVRPGAFAGPEKQPQPGAVETLSLDIPESPAATVIEQKVTAKKGMDLSEAGRVVSGGRGMGSAENFRLIEELASALDAAVGASRAVVDAGWRPHDEQVGKSGRTISPELYIACGISGAIHHTLGMNTSKIVVAINSDPEALIFQHADFGLVGDALKIVPELAQAFKSG